MNSSESEHCCNLLCQLYDPMSAISFIRECISKPMNPDPFLIIRNNFPFTLSLFLFSVIINFLKYKNISFIAFHKPKHYNHIFYCLSLHITAAQDFLALLHLHIYLFSVAHLFLVLYTYTHLVLDNHFVRLRAQSKFILLCRLLEEGHEGSVYTQFPESSI
jgi:hypothetical protein